MEELTSAIPAAEGCHSSVEFAIAYIQQHIYEKITVPDVAAHSHLNMTSLTRYFRRDTGRTLAGYIAEAKLQEAKRLLATSGNGYMQISDMLCFCSYSHFIQRFCSRFGMTPRQYRERLFNICICGKSEKRMGQAQ